MKVADSTSLVAEMVASLAEPVRLRMLCVLEREELAVGEVANVVQLPQSTVSRHLKVLAESNWVVRRTEGTTTLYRLRADDLSPTARAIWVGVRESVSHGRCAEDDRTRLAAVLAERRTDSQAFFGRVAGEWDAVRGELFGRDVTLRAALALLPAHWVVADLGCGTGNIAEVLAPMVEWVIAVDESPAMLAAARRRLDGVENVEFVRSSLEDLSLEADSVDAAVLSLVLHHVVDVPSALRSAASALRTSRGGGVLLIADMLQHDRAEYRATMGHKHLGFERQQMRDWLADAGLREDRWVRLPADAAAKGPGLFVLTARRQEVA